MSSAYSISQLPLANEEIERRRPSPRRGVPRSLRGYFPRIAAGLPAELEAELEADLGSALAKRVDGPFRRGALVGTLFRSAFPVQMGGVPALQPLFAAEAMSRARTMLGLVLLLEQNSWHGDKPWYPNVSPLTLHLELAVAKSIVSLFDALAVDSGHDARPCNEILAGLLSGFVELFGPGVGHLSLDLEAETLHLAGFKRRALVLAAIDLINRSMLHGLRRPHRGHFRATLRRSAGRRAEFTLEHHDRTVELAPPRESFGILGMMAALLEADLVCRRSPMGGSTIELQFPCSDAG